MSGRPLYLDSGSFHDVNLGGRRVLFHLPTSALFELDSVGEEVLDFLKRPRTAASAPAPATARAPGTEPAPPPPAPEESAAPPVPAIP